jgi:plastocyanin
VASRLTFEIHQLLEKHMKKLLSAFCLTALFGFAGCGAPATSEPPAATPAEPAEAAPAASEPEAESGAMRDDRPPAGRFVQANPKLATLRAKFVYGGKAPAKAKVDSSKDPFCAQIEILSEAMLVGSGGELQNLALIMDPRRSKAEIPADQMKAEPAIVELDNNGCAFKPHVFFGRPGQTVRVLNSDQTGHNANFNFFNNEAKNFLVPIGGQKDLTLTTDEPAPIPVECNIHPWMKAYIIVQEHPYVGITDENGELEIANLPVGEVTFRVWHENADGSIDEGEVGGKAQKWSRGRMEVDLKAGVNDLGTITIAADKFKS